MDLSRLKADKDARDSQEIAMARQRQTEQVRQNLLMREQAQRVATIPVCDLLFSIGLMFIVLQTAPAQLQPQQGSSQSQPPTAQQQSPLIQQHLHQQAQLQLHQLQAHQQAIQSQRSTGTPSTIPNRSARLSTAANARPSSQQGQHLQQGRGVQVSVPLQAGAQGNIVGLLILKNIPVSSIRMANGLPQAISAESP
jgi:chromatin modification-related protein VID21